MHTANLVAQFIATCAEAFEVDMIISYLISMALHHTALQHLSGCINYISSRIDNSGYPLLLTLAYH